MLEIIILIVLWDHTLFNVFLHVAITFDVVYVTNEFWLRDDILLILCGLRRQTTFAHFPNELNTSPGKQIGPFEGIYIYNKDEIVSF